ncbi:MAG: chromate efflux transporter [Anaerolineales bacterium]
MSLVSPRLREVVALFLRLGSTAFGGPAAHIALMHDETVTRRKWLTDEEFLDLLGATNLIPGPNSTEMTIHLGFRRASWWGLLLGGVSFVFPAMLITLALAWVYVELGTIPAAGWLLYGIKPMMMAIILKAIWELARKAFKNRVGLLIGALAAGLYFWGYNELLLMACGGIAALFLLPRPQAQTDSRPNGAWLLPALSVPAVLQVIPFHLSLLFLTFLKIGAVLYGSGYVLLAFLRADFVLRLGWLTDAQLLDAIAIGQVTPGPLFTTATFIGYLLGGVPGALLATLGIFLPSFGFVALTAPILPRLRANPHLARLLDGVNAAALGLMAAVSITLGRAALVDVWTIAAAALALIILLRYRVNATWLIAAGALLGLLRAWLG